MSSDSITTTQAADELSVTSQTIRNWLRRGVIQGDMSARPWVVRKMDVERMKGTEVAATPNPGSDTDDLSQRVDSLEAGLAELREHDRREPSAAAAERDRFRAEAASSREAALRLNAAARDTAAAMRQLLDALEQQSEAVSQLLLPSSAADLQDRTQR